MKEQEIIMPVTRKGQVTIPAVIRQFLGLQKTGRVAFAIEDGEVKIKPAKATLEAAYGAVKPLTQPEDFEKIAQIAQEEHAAQVVGKQG